MECGLQGGNIQQDCRITQEFKNTDKRHSPPLKLKDLRPDYNFEENRLLTYDRWPKSAPVDPVDLAKDGFIYTGKDDRVICFYCKTNIFNWEKGDVVSKEHRKHYGKCPLVLGKCTKNIPCSTNLDTTSIVTPVSSKLKEESSFTQSTEESLHIQGLWPKHPKYLSEVVRLNTFKTWPSQFSQRPADLAKAGFIYLGSGDKTKCFCCNGNLMNWDTPDEPIVEHARWFPDCGYVKLTKGAKFIEMVAASTRGQTKKIQDDYVTDAFLERLGTAEVRPNAVSSPPTYVLAVMEMGYSEEIIKDALRQKGKSYNNFKDAESLMRFMFQCDIEATSVPMSEVDAMLIDETDGTSMKAKRKETCDTPSPQHFVEASEKLQSLRTENSELRKQMLCRICMDKEMSIVFLPCGHLVSCGSCSASLRSCPLCRSPIKGTVKTYLG